MELFIEVERHPGAYFEPYIKDYFTEESAGCVFHFHEEGITGEGADLFRDVFLQQAQRWNPRAENMPRGRRIPIWMEMRTDLPEDYAILVEDQPTYIKYIARTGLITPRAAESITRHQSERSPDWWRLPARYGVRHKSVCG